MSSQRNLSDYTKIRSLGRGNTSNVHLARDPDGKDVALKIPHASVLKQKDAAERFGNEVRLSLRFKHARLVRGFAGTPFGSNAFLTMEYFPEGTLSERLNLLRRQREQRQIKQEAPDRPDKLGTLPEFELTDLYRIIGDVCSGLYFLHREEAVHQDVKTQNIYLKDGHAYLGDFGSTYFTSQGGKVSGSPFYMAPEIYHGLSSSSASDIYSLGVLIYEIIADKRPFTGSTYEELMVAHLTSVPVSLIRLNPEIPREFASIVDSALLKEATDRPSIMEIHDVIRGILGERTVIETPNIDTQQKQILGRHGPATQQNTAPPKTNANTSDSNGSTSESEGSAAKDSSKATAKGGFWKIFQRKK